MNILPQVRADNCAILECETRNDAKRIVKRALRRGWWCLVWTIENIPHVALSSAVDLESDLRRRLPGIGFRRLP